MRIITTKELYNLNAAPIVNSLFSIKWSADDHISVVTETGVHTLKWIPTPLCSKRILQLNRSYIYPPDFIPTEKFIDDVNSHILNWDREQVYTLLLETAISPKPNKANSIIPRIIDVAWSPKGLVQSNKCMLATLTSVGAVDIAVKFNRKWFSIHDLSLHWIKYLEETSTINEEENYIMYVAKARRYQAVSMVWSDLRTHDCNQYAYLVVIYRSSDLVIWKIEKASDSSQCEIKAPEIVCKLDLTYDAKVKISEWINVSDDENYLFIGYHDGKIQRLKIKENPDTLCLDVQQCSEDYFLDNDRIPISNISLLNNQDNILEIIVTKGSSLIYLCFNDNESLSKILTYRNPGFQVSGITIINSKEVLTFSEDGKLTLITILTEKLQGKAIKDEIVTSRLRCLGLSGSTNKSLFVTVTSPNGTYDHLVQREPTTIHFFFIEDERKDPFSILLNENVGKKLGNYWDCLEVLRMKIIDDKEYSELLYTRNDLECMSFGLLRTTMWINIIKENCYKSEINSQHPYNSNEAKSLIFLHTAVSIILLLTNKSDLSNEEKNILGLLKVYLEVYIGINDNNTLITKNIQNALMKIANLQLAKEELCELCNDSICDSSSTTSLCNSGHKLPRCALTLMQIRTIKFHVCPICKLIFHLAVENIWREPKCLYCDVSLIYNDFVKERKFVGNMKNLSQASSAILKGISSGDNNGVDEEDDVEI